MKVPILLSEAFGSDFQKTIAEFLVEEKLLESVDDIGAKRVLSRSVVPHVKKLSALFNRIEKQPEKTVAKGNSKKSRKPLPKQRPAEVKSDENRSLAKYWKESSNPAHLRLAYFLYFMPSNLYRIASIGAELKRLGWSWNAGKKLNAIEFGAGPATGACGVAAAAAWANLDLPRQGSWALIEQDQATLNLGARWAETYFKQLGSAAPQGAVCKDWTIRKFHREIDLKRGLLPRSAPQFNFWVFSYFLNELDVSADVLADLLVETWINHMEQEGIVVIVEPALRIESRKLLELRRALLARFSRMKKQEFQILTPCLGHQTCGALADTEREDWCHEEVTWWRPPYFRIIDDLASLDRKTLPFSYLVITRSERPRTEILSALSGTDPKGTVRLVSPTISQGQEREFFVCGQDGKRRTRVKPAHFPEIETDENPALSEVGRGDLLTGCELRGDLNATRIEKVTGIK